MATLPTRAGLPVDIIVNRRAHHLTTDTPVLCAIRDAANSAGSAGSAGPRETQDVQQHETWSESELVLVAKKIAARGTRAVILAGGDGSYMAGVTALAGAFGADLPPVALAPGGTVSTVARNWGFRGKMAPYAARLIRRVASGDARVLQVPTLRVRDDQSGDRVGFIFGAGLVANFFDAYYAGASVGYGAAAAIVARIFAGSFVRGELARKILTPVVANLTVNGESQPPHAWSLVAASVVRNLGLHMHLLHRAAEDPDRVHLVASPLGPHALGPQMPLVLTGQRLRGRGHVDTLAAAFTLTFADPGAYVLDGELLRCGVVSVSAGPRLSLLVI